jgi:hypothetical protein
MIRLGTPPFELSAILRPWGQVVTQDNPVRIIGESSPGRILVNAGDSGALGPSIDFTGNWNPGDVALIEWWAYCSLNEDGANDITIQPSISIGSIDQPIYLNAGFDREAIITQTSFGLSGSTSVPCPAAPVVGLNYINAGDKQVGIFAFLRVERIPPGVFLAAPNGPSGSLVTPP